MTFTASSNSISPDSEEVLSQQSKKNNIKEQLFTARKLFYSFYLMIDASKLSFSTIRYLFDMHLANTDAAAQAMREWMSSSLGLSTIILSSTSFIVLSLLANHLKEEDKNYFILFWPYARDAMKSLRNAYRAVQSTLTLICLLDIEDLRDFIVPASLLLGVVAVLNRVWFRFVASQRTKMMDENKKLLAEIHAATALDECKINEFINRIQEQTQQLRTQLLCSAIVSGIIDGFNPYIGILVLGSVTPTTLAVITAFCIIYLIATVAIKIYDELKAQEQLKNQEKEIYLALIEKQNPTIGHKKSNEITPTPIVVSGLKNGMMGYKCIMLAISTILFLSPIKFKSVDPIYRAILGLGSLLTFFVHAGVSSFINQATCEVSDDEAQAMYVDSSYSSPLVHEDSSNIVTNQCHTTVALEKRSNVLSMSRSIFFSSKLDKMEIYQPELNAGISIG